MPTLLARTAASVNGGDPVTSALTTIATNSLLGAIAVLGMTVMWLWIRRESARADRNEAALAANHIQMQEKVIPLLADAARVVAEGTVANREIARVLAEGQSANREMARLLADATAALRDAQPTRDAR